MVRSETFQLSVPEAGAGQRLDLWLAAQLPELSRSKIQKLITSQHILLNSRPCRGKDLLVAGDEVSVLGMPPAAPPALEPIALPLDIVYEDDELIVVNKPAGLAVHPGAGSHQATLVQGLLYHAGSLSRLSQEASWQRPGIVHRLDKDTSGLLVCAKTDFAHRHLAAQFQAKTNKRQYTALLDGILPQTELSYESYLMRDPRDRLRFTSLPVDAVRARFEADKVPRSQRWAKSVLRTTATYGHKLSLAEITLYTGRTHQIRVHAKALGCAVWGDPLYHQKRDLPQVFPAAVRAALQAVQRQLLHARWLGFEHPRGRGALLFEAPVPEDFQKVLDHLGPYQQLVL